MKASISIALALMLAPAFAQDASSEQRPERPRRHRISPEMIKKYDKDGDGKLNEEERKAMREDFRKAHDAEMIKKYDKDGDGKLSEEERKAMREDLRQHRESRGGDRRRGPREPSPEMIKKYDKDGDGKLSDEERKAMREDRRREREEKRQQDSK